LGRKGKTAQYLLPEGRKTAEREIERKSGQCGWIFFAEKGTETEGKIRLYTCISVF